MNNEVGNCKYAGVFFNMDEDKCYHSGYVGIYGSFIGSTINTIRAESGWEAKHIRVAECEKNLELHSGS